MKRIVTWIKDWRNRMLINRAIKRADKLHELTGKRYFVMPGDAGLQVVDNEYLKSYNRSAARNHTRRWTIKDVLEVCYYATGSTTNKR